MDASRKDASTAAEVAEPSATEAEAVQQDSAASPAAPGAPAASDAPGGAADEMSGETPDDLAALTAELEQLRAEKTDLLDRFQRAQAEFENFRKRLVREKEESANYAAMETIRSLLPVVDDFERALETPGLDEEIRKGLGLVHKALFDILSRAGLSPVEETGKFNPHIHHAVDRAPVEQDDQDQDILEILQRGYRFKDRLLRPALVKVAVKE